MCNLFVEISEGIEALIQLVFRVMAIACFGAVAILPFRALIDWIRERKKKHDKKDVHPQEQSANDDKTDEPF